MKLTQIRGNTWVAEGLEFIPFYRLDGGRVILLDTGLHQEQDDLNETLRANGLTPAGILNSHTHVDHCGNNRFLQQTYGCSVAMTAPEAAMCQNLLTLKCYYLLLSPDMVAREAGFLVHRPDIIVPEEDGPFSFLGAEFHILHTPGHSAGHISIVTPDGVCYVGDAALSRETLSAKLPYSLSHALAEQSRSKLAGLNCQAYVMAHRGVCAPEAFPALIQDNQALLRRRAGEILALIDRPMTASEINQAVCAQDKLLTHKPTRALRFERNIRLFLDYLVDTGRVQLSCEEGTLLYSVEL